jgi:hypothetical protein
MLEEVTNPLTCVDWVSSELTLYLSIGRKVEGALAWILPRRRSGPRLRVSFWGLTWGVLLGRL